MKWHCRTAAWWIAGCVSLAVFSAPGQTITNFSFEADHYTVSPGYASGNGGKITGWVLSNPSQIGLNLGGSNDPGLFADNGMIPDGTNVAFIQSTGAANSLSTTISGLIPGAVYQVAFRANRRSLYNDPVATWSLNGAAFVPLTCLPAVGGSNPYYANSKTFTATSNTAPLVVRNSVPSGEDATVLLDDFTVQILPQTLILYQVNASDADTVSNDTIPNLGVLGTGTIGGAEVTLTNDVPTNGVPPGFGNNSLVFDGQSGVLSQGTLQLTRTNIAYAGGFTYEAWFKWNGGGNNNVIIDYAGTEKLIRRATDTGPTMETDNATLSPIGAAASNQWHYVAVVFTATSSNLASDSVTGNYTFYLDTNTPTATVANITINSFGDTLDRTIGVGTHPSGFTSDYFNGLIYEPRVTLGALAGSNLLFKSTANVTSVADAGPGTLRAALTNAANAFIVFTPGLSGQTITLSNGQIELSRNVMIDASALAKGIQFNGNGNDSRVLQVDREVTAVLNSVTIANGRDNDDTHGGGGILNFGALTLNNCVVSGNESIKSYDGGGGVDSYGSLTLNHCLISGNTINPSYGGGGGVTSFGTFVANNCTFANNSGDNANSGGGGLYLGEGGTVNNCTFFGNSANYSAFGGGGIHAENTESTVNNCTFFGNQALNTINGEGGGAISSYGADMTVNNATLFGNQADYGGGASGDSAAFYFTNCIICSNIASSGVGGSAYFQDSANLSLSDCILSGNPLLAPLGNYGGPTQTMPPLPGSPVINAGTDSVTGFLATDQRGQPRLSGAHVDIGAVEVNTNAFVTTAANTGTGSLRNAVASALPNDVVFFATNLSDQVIELSTGQIVLSNNVTIDSSELAVPVQINGNGNSRIFAITGGASVTLNSLALNNGLASGSYGGALSNTAGATAWLMNCLVANSSAGIYGGGIVNNGTMTLSNCTVAANSAGQYGGGINNDGTLYLEQCTVADNSASVGGGGISSGGQLTLIQSTVSSNSATSMAGGIHSGGALIFSNSIVAGNSAPSSTDLDSGFTGATNQIGGNPSLAPLGFYGGLTPTMPPLPGSPVVNAGNDAVAGNFATDQRGYPRMAGTHADLGAVEGVHVTDLGKLTNTTSANGAFQFSFTNLTDANLPVLAAPNANAAASGWTRIGFATENPAGSGQYQFSDPGANTSPQRFYRVQSP